MGRLDVAEADFEMALIVLTAGNERRVQGQGDRRRWRCRLGWGCVTQPLADHQGAPAHGLGMDPGIDRQKMFKLAGGDPTGHERR